MNRTEQNIVAAITWICGTGLIGTGVAMASENIGEGLGVAGIFILILGAVIFFENVK